MKTITKDQRIVNALLLNASFIDMLGLMHGKTGIAIYFFHLAEQSNNQIYEDYAGELIDEIIEEITANTPIEFENGLAGIGWGIEYLVQNGFIEADTNEVLEEFDRRIFTGVIHNTFNEIGLLKGIVGLGAYLLKRIQNPQLDGDSIPVLTNKQLLVHIIGELDMRMQDLADISKEPTISFSTGILNEEGQQSSLDVMVNGNNKMFDLLWDLPLLIWFLSELCLQNIFNFKIEKIIQRLLEPLTDNSNLPENHNNRALLSLALTKLSQTEWGHSNERKVELDKVIKALMLGTTRKTVAQGLLPDNPGIRQGTMGMAWIYRQLYRLTSTDEYNKEMKYWVKQTFSLTEKDTGHAGFEFKNINHAFGIFEGLAGIGLNYLIIQQFDNLSILK